MDCQLLKFASKIMGRTEVQYIDGGVVAHLTGLYKMDDIENILGEDHPVILEQKECIIVHNDMFSIGNGVDPITLDEIIDAIQSYEDQPYVQAAMSSGRSYFFDGINQTDGDENAWEFEWGS